MLDVTWLTLYGPISYSSGINALLIGGIDFVLGFLLLSGMSGLGRQ